MFNHLAVLDRIVAKAAEVPSFTSEENDLEAFNDSNKRITLTVGKVMQDYKEAVSKYIDEKAQYDLRYPDDTSPRPPSPKQPEAPRFYGYVKDLTAIIESSKNYTQQFKQLSEAYKRPSFRVACLRKINRTSVELIDWSLLIISVGYVILGYIPSDTAQNKRAELLSNKEPTIDNFLILVPYLLQKFYKKLTLIKEAGMKTTQLLNRLYNFSMEVMNQALSNHSIIRHLEEPSNPNLLNEAIILAKINIDTTPPKSLKKKKPQEQEETPKISRWEKAVKTLKRIKPGSSRSEHPPELTAKTRRITKINSTSVYNRKILEDLCHTVIKQQNSNPPVDRNSSSPSMVQHISHSTDSNDSSSRKDFSPRVCSILKDVFPTSPTVQAITERCLDQEDTFQLREEKLPTIDKNRMFYRDQETTTCIPRQEQRHHIFSDNDLTYDPSPIRVGLRSIAKDNSFRDNGKGVFSSSREPSGDQTRGSAFWSPSIARRATEPYSRDRLSTSPTLVPPFSEIPVSHTEIDPQQVVIVDVT